MNTKGNLALATSSATGNFRLYCNTWTSKQLDLIQKQLLGLQGVTLVKECNEYILFKEEISDFFCTKDLIGGTNEEAENIVKSRVKSNSFNSPICIKKLNNETNNNNITHYVNNNITNDNNTIYSNNATYTNIQLNNNNVTTSNNNDTTNNNNTNTILSPLNNKQYHCDHKNFDFLEALTDDSIYDERLSSIKTMSDLVSDKITFNISCNADYQYCIDEKGNKYRKIITLSMCCAIRNVVYNYYFVIKTSHQNVKPIKGCGFSFDKCLSDILKDINESCVVHFPKVKKNIIKMKTGKKIKGQDKSTNLINTVAMKDKMIPINIICEKPEAFFSLFRRYETDKHIFENLSYYGNHSTVRSLSMKVNADIHNNYYYLVSLNVRAMSGIMSSKIKSVMELDKNLKPLPRRYQNNQLTYAVLDMKNYYGYVSGISKTELKYCSRLFKINHAIPYSLSKHVENMLHDNIYDALGASSKAEYNLKYRGMIEVDDGSSISEDDEHHSNKRIDSIPNATIMNKYSRNAFTGGYNSCIIPGWIYEFTFDWDIRAAYGVSACCLRDIDWSKEFQVIIPDKGQEYLQLTLDHIKSPLDPICAVGTFSFPEDCYLPNIPVRPKGENFAIYPLYGKEVYMNASSMFLALNLGARIKVRKLFVYEPIHYHNGNYYTEFVSRLINDRFKIEEIFPNDKTYSGIIKQLVTSTAGKVQQGVSLREEYDDMTGAFVKRNYSRTSSPYHANLVVGLTRDYLLACANQLHKMGYKIFSITTDGFITNVADKKILTDLDAFGYGDIFRRGNNIIDGKSMNYKNENVWSLKHYNIECYNFSTRGNVGTNDAGVLAHNGYKTGEVKDSKADRDRLIIDCLTRDGKLEMKQMRVTPYKEILQKRKDFIEIEEISHKSMEFDFKRDIVLDTVVDKNVRYTSSTIDKSADVNVFTCDTKPYHDVEEFLKKREIVKKCIKKGQSIKTKKDLENIEEQVKMLDYNDVGYKNNPIKKKLLSIIHRYQTGEYNIPILDDLTIEKAVDVVNSWNICQIKVSDWKNYSKNSKRKILPDEATKEMLETIINKCK